MDQLNLKAWVGRAVTTQGQVDEATAARVSATLRADDPPLRAGEALPPLWHWFACLDAIPTAGLSPDGHPTVTPPMPPMPGKRRMWGAGALTFGAPLHVGEALTKETRVASVDDIVAKSGAMTRVRVEHRITGSGGGQVMEQQDIVYLEPRDHYAAPRKRALTGRLVGAHALDEVTLFRFSALTFNSHRIHYDRTYAQQAEHYPDLVVHGPLQAIWLAAAATAERGRAPREFTFRGLHPMFVSGIANITVEEDGSTLTLMTGQNGHQCMTASALWEDTV
ncbi:MAG: FAS1-like dehydratase domain-containing protein [Shimia sp.]